jgi:hypothetical protein
MPAPDPVSRQVRVETLWTLLRSLAARLWSTGMEAGRLHATWSARVHVACEACDTNLTEAELTAVLDLPEGAEPTDARLQRLAQGYCPKPGCTSRFYRITLDPAEELDWNALLDASEKPRVPETDHPSTPGSPRPSPLANKPLRIALAIVALLVAFLLRQWYVNGTIPFVSRSFKVAPSETSPTPVPAPAAPSTEPRSNTFRIAP